MFKTDQQLTSNITPKPEDHIREPISFKHEYRSPVMPNEKILNILAFLKNFSIIRVNDKESATCEHTIHGYILVIETPISAKRLFAILTEIGSWNEYGCFDDSQTPNIDDLDRVVTS